MGFQCQKHGVYALVLVLLLFLQGCISPSNEVIEGLGTPDLACKPMEGVLDGSLYEARTDPVPFGTDNRKHPDVFYVGWSKLDDRSDLRFASKGYTSALYEDRLFVSRKLINSTPDNPVKKTWQLLPLTDNNCRDIEKIRIHSFDVAPNGRSLYVSMAKNGIDTHLGIYRFDLETFTLTKISQDNGTHFMYPTYVGNDPSTKNEMLVVAKTVDDTEIPINYAARSIMKDEYDRDSTPLIHKMDAQTGEVTRIGFNNSHQTEPFVMVGPDDNRIVVFTQWEHQDNVNRFSLWKTQIDGSDNFTFYGDESIIGGGTANLIQPRAVRSGPYANYILMTEGHKEFDAEGHIAMTFRQHQELRSHKYYLHRVNNGSTTPGIARNPEHYNDESFVYSYRQDTNYTYDIYVKDFPTTPSGTVSEGAGTQLSPETDSFHFVQARSFYPPERELIAPTDAADLGENRVSFTNPHLNGKSGFLVQNLTQSDNGVQHQLDNLSPNDIAMQFFIPSHHFNHSNTVGLKSSPNMSIPASGFIKPEADGSMGVILKNGLYVWNVNKRFNHGGTEGPSGDDGTDIWIPVRAERQEVSFVKNRVNACNQCHQERSQANIDQYATYDSIAAQKMRGSLSGLLGTANDITGYNAAYSVPDFHKDIVPLLSDPVYKGPTGKTCAECHSVGTKLDLSNNTGPAKTNLTYKNLIRGAHKLPSGSVVNYSNDSINPMGIENQYRPAPFLWSLLLNDDLAPDNAANNGSRALTAVGDYGANFNQEVKDAIVTINGKYDHSKHWDAATIQKFITYSSTQMPVGLSDRISFVEKGGDYTSGAAAQKAYQAIVRSCFDCHNSFTGANAGGIETPSFGYPEDKRFVIDLDDGTSSFMSDRSMRFMVHNHVANKADTHYSQLLGLSKLTTSMEHTLESARYHINFDNPEESALLKHALGLAKTTLRADTNMPPFVNHPAVLNEGSVDYNAIKNWVTKQWSNIKNNPPQIDINPISGITIKEYDVPIIFGGINGNFLTWSDTDGGNPLGATSYSTDANSGVEYSQVYIGGDQNRHSMLSMEYRSFNSADLEAYAILGDAQQTEVKFVATDGGNTSELEIPVTVTTDYTVPAPSATFPDAYAFYTTRYVTQQGVVTQPGGVLRKLSTVNGVKQDETIGTITGYTNDWSTMYRRADRGWLYFLNQKEQKVYVVSETTAELLFSFKLDLSASKRGPNHKQTVYLLWWRPNDGDGDGPDDMDHLGNKNCPHGELQALVESKLSNESERNGDFYIGLGCGEMVDTAAAGTDIIAETTSHLNVVNPNTNTERFNALKQSNYNYQHPSSYRTKLARGGNTLSVYTWRRATFMGRWNSEEVDEINVLNLVTGKDKTLGNFDFKAQDGYVADKYWNVRAVVVAEDGAFYGFNKDANDAPVEIFNFDPVKNIQQQVVSPPWVDEYFNNYPLYGTPFLVIKPRSP